MKRGLLNKRIPNILGLLFLAGAIGGGIYLVRQGKLTTLKKEPSAAPTKVNITNVSESQFTVSWTTDQKTLAFIKYGQTPNLKDKALDDRSQLSGEEATSLIHFVTVKNLSPSTTYYFKIGVGKQLYDNNGQAYTVTTGPALGSAGAAKIVSGKVLNQDKTPTSQAIVYLTATNTAPYSSLTDDEGRWAIFLNKARSTDLLSYTLFDPEATVLKIDVEAGLQTASAVTLTKYAFPVPDIVLGQPPYDFREGPLAEEKIEEEALAQKEKTPSQFVLQPLSSASPSAAPSNQVIINNPGEGEEINSLQPEIRGTGPAFKVLTIRIESPATASATITVDETGHWNFTPLEDLSLGAHTIYLSYVDAEGETQTLTRNFTVLAAEESDLPAFTATPSGETTPSATIAPSPIARVSLPSTEAGVPTTGIITPTLLVLLTGVLMIICGITVLVVIDKVLVI